MPTKGVDVYGSYHRFVETLPCIAARLKNHRCQFYDGRPGIEGHHLKHVGSGGLDYENEVPCCPAVHDDIHWSPEKWEQRTGINLAREAIEVRVLFDSQQVVVWANLLDANRVVHRAIGPAVTTCHYDGPVETTEKSVTCRKCETEDRF